MPLQKAPERRRNRRYTVVLVPEGETRRSITLSFSLLGLAAVIGGSILVIMSIIVAAVIYTPLGSRLPIHSAELERRYGKQIVGIQEQLRSLVQEVGELRAYNLQLRQALGEDVDSQRQALMQSMAQESTRVAEGEQAGAGAAAGLAEQASDAAAQPEEGSEPPRVVRKNGMPAFPFIAPVEGFESRGYDAGQLHYGLDFAGKRGTIISAAADGMVLFAGWTYDDGFTMMLGHEAGYVTAYKHNQALLKPAGTYVRRGEAIALLGNTGRTSSGPHLHFELWKDGVALDPAHYVLHTQ